VKKAIRAGCSRTTQGISACGQACACPCCACMCSAASGMASPSV